jgi:hypothetical protein
LIAFLFVFVAESFAFGLMWYNKSARSERERESERPEPAVLFSRRSIHSRKPAKLAQMPPDENSKSHINLIEAVAAAKDATQMANP